jgi:hypothetical protein
MEILQSQTKKANKYIYLTYVLVVQLMLDALSHQFQSCRINYIYATTSTAAGRRPRLQNAIADARIGQIFEAAQIIARRRVRGSALNSSNAS